MSDTITLDEAQQRLGDAGYEVCMDDHGILIAEQTIGIEHLTVVVSEHHLYQVVAHDQIDEFDGSADSVRFQHGLTRGDVFRPFSFTRAVRRGVALARLIRMYDAAISAEMASYSAKHLAEDDQAPEAEPVQGDAEPAESAVTA